MVAIPIQATDPTLEAADRALEGAEFRRGRRDYLGMSAIGNECDRNLWYDLRWVMKVKHNAETLKRFADGHHGEDLQADRLRMVDGITLLTVDPDNGRQFGFSDCDEHFKGHMDGAILGLLQAPKSWHVWEHKQVGDKKQAELIKLKERLGEKNALKAWNPVYYAQGLLYMHYSGMTRHYLTCSTPGGRSTVSIRTDPDIAEALRLIARADRIIKAPVPPGRISEDPAWFKCRWCNFHSLCHGDTPADRSCRTCLHSSPVADGKWWCSRHECELSRAEQEQGCPDHRFIPPIVHGEQSDVDGDTVIYLLKTGELWRDEGPYRET